MSPYDKTCTPNSGLEKHRQRFKILWISILFAFSLFFFPLIWFYCIRYRSIQIQLCYQPRGKFPIILRHVFYAYKISHQSSYSHSDKMYGINTCVPHICSKSQRLIYHCLDFDITVYSSSNWAWNGITLILSDFSITLVLHARRHTVSLNIFNSFNCLTYKSKHNTSYWSQYPTSTDFSLTVTEHFRQCYVPESHIASATHFEMILFCIILKFTSKNLNIQISE